jgi:hypothetical protein
MANKKRNIADFNPEAVDKLAQDKPVVDKIFDKNDRNIYTGSAKRGRIEKCEMIEHLSGSRESIRSLLIDNRKSLWRRLSSLSARCIFIITQLVSLALRK